MCVCSRSYPACNAHAPCCHLRHIRPYHIFPHYLINGTIFGKKKKLFNIKCVLRFSLQLLFETFLSLRRIQRNTINGLHYRTRYSGQPFKKLRIFSTDFRILKYQISRKSVQWEPSCSIRVDGRTVMTKLTVAFRNSANTPHNNKRDVSVQQN